MWKLILGMRILKLSRRNGGLRRDMNELVKEVLQKDVESGLEPDHIVLLMDYVLGKEGVCHY